MRSLLPLLLLALLASPTAQAQSLIGLQAYFSFDDCTATDQTPNASVGTLSGGITCGCGIVGQAVKLDGIDDYVTFFGPINTYFDNSDFSVAFYYKSLSTFQERTILSKRSACDRFATFEIDLKANQNAVKCELNEDETHNATLEAPEDPNACWQHIALVRRSRFIYLYLNGELRDTANSIINLDINNGAELTIGTGECVGIGGRGNFKGYIDELRVYNLALSKNDVQTLIYNVDKIANRDTILYKGNSLAPFVNSLCAVSYEWTPTTGVSDPNIKLPILTPDTTTTYVLRMKDADGCIATDSLRINVIDPNDLNCEQIFMPSAFTPNEDGLNDTYSISNPIAIPDLTSFEIFDRWGGRVFTTNNPNERWDGTFGGRTLPPGVYVYQLRYNCKNTKFHKTGSITLMR
jgi:gliding motility-associated-like protein